MTRIAILLVSLLPAIAVAAEQSPYAAQELRAVKSMSEREIESLRQGEGMGFAKLAELNHYPGPKHVLQIAAELELSEEQLAATNRLYKHMREHAVSLGEQLIEAEAKLDRAFAEGVVSDESLLSSLQQIGELRIRLRYVHLEAHLRQKQLLSTEQVVKYDSLRGYSDRDKAHHEHGKHHN